MKTKEYTFPSASALCDIKAWQWAPETETVKAVILLHHGMAEHCGRYSETVQALTDLGYAVFMHDMLGHGQSVGDPALLGYFGDRDGCRALLQDAKSLYDLARQAYPDKKLILAGHSMGSLVMRCFLGEYNCAYDGAVYIGTSGPNPLGKVSTLLTGLLGAIKGRKYKSALIDKMGFGSYNKQFEKRTAYDWLTRDNAVVDAYIADEKSGFLFSVAGYADLAQLVMQCNSSDWYRRVPQDLPVLFLSGAMDPVGNYGKGVAQVVDKLRATGHTNVQLRLYPEARHELFNELNRQEVLRDLDAFLTDAVLNRDGQAQKKAPVTAGAKV